MTHLRKDQAEDLLAGLESATSGPLEEITVARERLSVALRIILVSDASWEQLIADAAKADSWSEERTALLTSASRPDEAPDPESLLWGLWDLVTELNERRTLG